MNPRLRVQSTWGKYIIDHGLKLLIKTIQLIYFIIQVVLEVQKENTTIIPNKHKKLQMKI